MGDSYASGQGADNYSGGSCRRSANAYWALLHNRLRHGLTSSASEFVACSGATTADVRAHQLGALDPTTRLVTLSVGGDNLGFSGVVKSCVKPGGTSCKQALRDHVNTSSLRRLRASLRAIYSDIRSRATSATVLVLGYPQLTPADHIDGCGAMDSSDAPYLHRAGVRLNRSIQRAVGSRRGFRFIGLVSRPRTTRRATTAWRTGSTASTSPTSRSPSTPTCSGQRAIAAHLAAVAPGFFR